MDFYRSVERLDVWDAYVTGATDVYRRHGVEDALKIPSPASESAMPIFAVATDNGTVVAGFYVNGPLTAVSEAFAPDEFAADPISATLVAEWIAQALRVGVIELKAGWVDPDTRHKAALADLVARSFVYAMSLLDVQYAFGTVAQHAAPRWKSAGARPLPTVPPTPFPDDRYHTSFFCWDIDTAFSLSSAEQQQLFQADRDTMDPAPVTTAERAW